MNKKIIINVVIIMLFVLVVINISIFISDKNKIKTINNNLDIYNINENEVINKSNDEIISDLINKYNNNDIVGTLNIPNVLYIPIVKYIDNTYYLDHSLYKEKDNIGTPFIDYKTELNSKQINIYAHNSKEYDVPFKNLEKYLNKEFYENNNIIILETLNNIVNYEIFSVSIIPKSDNAEHLKYTYNTNEEWLLHFNKLEELSIYNNNIELSIDDNILVLQTCLFDKYDNNFLVISARQKNKTVY